MATSYRLAAIAASLTLAVSGCGSSKSTSKQTTSNAAPHGTINSAIAAPHTAVVTATPLTNARLVAAVNAVCRQAITHKPHLKITSPAEFAIAVPIVAGWNNGVSSKLQRLTPPPSDRADFARLRADVRTLAEAASKIGGYAQIGQVTRAAPLFVQYRVTLAQLHSTAAHAGFSACVRY